MPPPRPVVAARPTDRLFFAVYPDDAARDRLARLAQSLRLRHGLQGRAFAPARLHVTLAMAGDHVGLPPSLVEQAMAAGAAVHGAPFALSFDRIATFARAKNRPCVLLARDGADRLAALHEALTQALRSVGLVVPAERRYRPHLTLQYDDRGLPEEPIEPIGWTVTEFVLMRSLLGRSQHVALARWPLRG